MQEIWKNVTISPYSDYYMVSNLGNVKNISSNRILKQSKTKDGYLMVVMCVNGKTKTLTVHRLVAMSFIENPNNLPQVNHIDGNKKNNNVSNIEWCTAKQNMHHAVKSGLFEKRTGIRPVYQFSLDGKFIKKWESGMEASHYLGKKEQSIYKCCNNVMHSAHGFYWSYSPKFNRKLSNKEWYHNNGVIQYDLNGNELKRFDSIKQAADEVGVSPVRICCCCRGKSRTSKGFIWKYAEGD